MEVTIKIAVVAFVLSWAASTATPLHPQGFEQTFLRSFIIPGTFTFLFCAIMRLLTEDPAWFRLY